MNKDKYTAIYVRRSLSDVDKGNNSLSITAQREECIREVGKGRAYKVYCDDGKSGKDIEHRPEFMQMMSDVKDGLIDRIIVKKYDRFCRSLRDYLNVSYELGKYGVSLKSLTEPFETETKEGRMMTNNLLNFAEFERETIAARVKDAYSTKARETGFYQGGNLCFGYQPSRQTVNGKTGSVLVPSPQAYAVQMAYEVYRKPETGLMDVIHFYRENNIDTAVKGRNGKVRDMSKVHISEILRNPLYVRADKDVYDYLVSQGIEMLDDVSMYDGVHGLFLHNRGKAAFVKVGYHEGLIDSETWLAVQDKKSHTEKFNGKKKNVGFWLAGLVILITD